MASILAEKIEEITECSICHDEFESPVHLLPCLHVFCLGCIEDCIEARENEDNGSLDCPYCREPAEIPPEGTGNLRNSFIITDLLDKLRSCRNSTVHCNLHQGKAILMYCTDCKENMCIDCIQYHKEHDFDSIERKREEVEKTIEEKIQTLGPNLEILEERRSEQDAVMKNFDKQTDEVVKSFIEVMTTLAEQGINKLVSPEKQRLYQHFSRIDKDKKGLQNLLDRGQTENENEDKTAVREFVSRNEVLNELEAANLGEADISVKPGFKVDLKREIKLDLSKFFKVKEIPGTPGEATTEQGVHSDGTGINVPSSINLKNTMAFQGSTIKGRVVFRRRANSQSNITTILPPPRKRSSQSTSRNEHVNTDPQMSSKLRKLSRRGQEDESESSDEEIVVT